MSTLPDAKYVFDVATQVKSLTGRTMDFPAGVPTHVPGMCRVEVEQAGGKLVGDPAPSAAAPPLLPEPERKLPPKRAPMPEVRTTVRLADKVKAELVTRPKPSAKKRPPPSARGRR